MQIRVGPKHIKIFFVMLSSTPLRLFLPPPSLIFLSTVCGVQLVSFESDRQEATKPMMTPTCCQMYPPKWIDSLAHLERPNQSLYWGQGSRRRPSWVSSFNSAGSFSSFGQNHLGMMYSTCSHRNSDLLQQPSTRATAPVDPAPSAGLPGELSRKRQNSGRKLSMVLVLGEEKKVVKPLSAASWGTAVK